jgi:hypothetical protein
MKRFLVWLLIVVGLYAAIAVPSHMALSARPRSIAVAVDTSFEMQAAQQDVRRALAGLAGIRYARFSLVTDKVRVHGWQESLDAGGALSYYGPRDLAALADSTRFPELAAADSVVVITDARDTTPLRGLRGLRVISVR